MSYAFSDLTLSRRLERCEAKSNAAFVEARARLTPESGAAWIERAGAYAMFDGVGSPLTQTFGLGVFATPAADDLDHIETFFRERGSAVFHEVSPIAPVETMQLLVDRGYHPIELTSVMHRPLTREAIAASDIRTRIVGPDEIELWAETAARGWSHSETLASYMRDLGRITATANGVSPFLAELDGRAIAAGTLSIHDGVALFAGASTIPDARNRGAQRALLEARLQYAAERGCDLAMMCAAPGSTSQRNAERRGFRIAYTRIKWGTAG
ncbi:MAG TPA: GNAT family N-acetyltransferase [Thermoanaerobaculia bacterium]|nr:GNAT family N-acetyltransferase [Thermoanaerobaculia bacterium]